MPDDLKIAFSKNLRMALACAMLFLPSSSFTMEELFLSVAGLSYLGDYRVGLAENPNKVRNIVHGGNNLHHFGKLYSDSIEYFLRSGLIRRIDANRYEVLSPSLLLLTLV